MTLRKFQPANTFQVAMAFLIEDTNLTGQRRALVRERPRRQWARTVASRGLGLLLLCVALAVVTVPVVGVAALLGALSAGSAALLAAAIWVALPLLAVGGVAVCSLLDDRA